MKYTKDDLHIGQKIRMNIKSYFIIKLDVEQGTVTLARNKLHCTFDLGYVLNRLNDRTSPWKIKSSKSLVTDNYEIF